MLIIPSSLLMITTMVVSTMMAILSSNWFLAWIAMEINLISFIPLMNMTKSNQEAEASVKYFLAQAIGSALMLLSSMSLWSMPSMNTLWPLLLIMSMLIKLGAAPLHFWYPSVMTSLSWSGALLLTTWQKLAPLALLSYAAWPQPSNSHILAMCAALNAMIGGILGMNQSHIRTLLAYSSITHMGWMMGALLVMTPHLTMTYFSLYVVIVSPMFILLNSLSVNTSAQVMKMTSLSLASSSMLILLLLSLGGLPPLTGFLPKWLLIMALMSSNSLTIIPLLLGSYMNLYFYLNLAFNMITTSTTPTVHPQKPNNSLLLALPGTSLLGLIMVATYAMT
nr:NADH dehydrogenase subunit 2 [Tubifex tubifex]